MDIRIRYRCDSEDYFTTDDTVLTNTTWEAVLREIMQIESHDTVLEITRIFP